MKILSRNDLRNQLKRKEIAPVYLFFGQETYLRDLAAKTVTEFVLGGSQARDFNEAYFKLSEINVGSVVAAARQLPMLDSRRVVIADEAAISAIKTRDNIAEEDEDVLSEYLKDPSETTVLIFIADELDKRRKMSKLIINNSVAVDFQVLDDNELVSWAKDKVRELGADSDAKALRQLVGLVGDDVRKLTIEIEKLAAAALPDSKITYDLVESLVPNSRELTNFELTDNLLEKNKTRSLMVMKKILDDGAEPLMLLGLLSYNFRRLFLAKEMMENGVNRSEISKVMRLPYRGQETFLATARRTDRKVFINILNKLAKTDLNIKTSVTSQRLQIELLICELASL